MVRLFGTTLNETITALTSELHFGTDQATSAKEDKIKAWGRLIVSILLLGFAFYSLAKGQTDIGGTIIGAITGYWLK